MSEDDVCVFFLNAFFTISCIQQLKIVFYYNNSQSYAFNRHVSSNKNILATYFL